MKKKILILAGYYTPSVKAGGPVQSIKNMVESLKDRYDFYIVANDRDLGDLKPFDDIKYGKWTSTEAGKVYYIDSRKMTPIKLLKVIKSMDFDILYLNSFFSFNLSILPIVLAKIRLFSFEKIIIAPRGNFSKGALQLKPLKKKVHIHISRILSLYSKVQWHATAVSEKNDIQQIFGEDCNISIARNLTANYSNLIYEKKVKKEKGKMDVVFISRIHPKKNLEQAIEFLQYLKGDVTFNIYGPIENNDYWQKCNNKIYSLPNNVKVSYQGYVEHKEIINIFKSHHTFLFPTLGENFGHVISESLIAGCPVIISDRTPWIKLEKMKVGWDINLENNKKFIQKLQYILDMNSDEYAKFSENAFNYAKKSANQEEIKKAYLLLFD
ncbi:Glycosyl transferase, group 1 [Alkalibacterium sp. AK22]|uniref:glycosyltransferase family 4 protein n=1 Tax=Alkalibacterium sp. AK22 TaxID=1229520 RepID=UPI00044981AE|nr:glycosyltransferase family 4 protein [Alkalibacterium sp. AK22]EXJ23319.1 Glycosyl transferase, group 1 [Alkalibacterium sp. AK22]